MALQYQWIIRENGEWLKAGTVERRDQVGSVRPVRWFYMCGECGEPWVKEIGLGRILFKTTLCPDCGGGTILADWVCRVKGQVRTWDFREKPTPVLLRELLRQGGIPCTWKEILEPRT